MGYEAERTERSFRKLIQNKPPGVAEMTSRIGASLGDMLEANGVASVFLDGRVTRALRSDIRVDYAKGTHEAYRAALDLFGAAAADCGRGERCRKG